MVASIQKSSESSDMWKVKNESNLVDKRVIITHELKQLTNEKNYIYIKQLREKGCCAKYIMGFQSSHKNR